MAPPDASRAIHALRSIFSALCASDAFDVSAVATAVRATDAPRDACEAAERLQQIAQTACEMIAIALPRTVLAASGCGPAAAMSPDSPAWAASTEAAAELISGAVWTSERLAGCVEALQAFVDVRRLVEPVVRLGWGPHAFETPAQASLGRGCAAAEAGEVQPLELSAAATLLCTLLAVRETKEFFARKPVGMALKPCVQLLSRCGTDPAVVIADVWTQVSTLASALLPADSESTARALVEFRRQGSRDALQWQRVAAAVQSIEGATASEAVTARAVLVLLHSALAVGSILGPTHDDIAALVADSRDAAVVVASISGAEGTAGTLVTRAGSSTAVSVESLRSNLAKPCRVAFAMFSVALRQHESRLRVSAELDVRALADATSAELLVSSTCGSTAAAQTPRRSTGSAMAVSISLGARPASHLGSSAKTNVA